MIVSHDLSFSQKMTSPFLQSLGFNCKCLLNYDRFMDSSERTCTYSTHCAITVDSETIRTNPHFRNNTE